MAASTTVAADTRPADRQQPWLVRVVHDESSLFRLGFLLWLVSRLFVLLHQGEWPWMNFFVVETARGALAGNWDEAFRPPLPALMAMPFVAAGLPEQFTVGVLYLFVSLVQFWAFSVLVRRIFPGRTLEQGLAMLIFLLIPINHSIHHWRNVPVVLASSALFLLAAHWLKVTSSPTAYIWSRKSIAWALGCILVGIWCRAELATFAAVLLMLGWVRRQPGIAKLTVIYVLGLAIAFGGNALLARAANASVYMQNRYAVHTFLDSTPASWLTHECRNYPTENCREDDGWLYFGPRDMNTTLLNIILQHPGLTIWKSAQSAVDNLWELFGRNISTYPTWAWLAALILIFYRPARQALGALSFPVWSVAVAALAVTVLPPLSWAPAHPQYHLHSLAGVVIIAVPLMTSMLRMSRGQWYVVGFLIWNAALSAFRYTRYPGY